MSRSLGADDRADGSGADTVALVQGMCGARVERVLRTWKRRGLAAAGLPQRVQLHLWPAPTCAPEPAGHVCGSFARKPVHRNVLVAAFPIQMNLHLF